MPANDETYYRQPRLHIVFGLSSLAMALVSVWMIMADHLRPWKVVQREFQTVETKKLRASEQRKQAELQKKFETQIKLLNEQVTRAEKRESDYARRIADLDARIKSYTGQYEKLDTETRFMKAELDSLRSIYDGLIDRDLRAEADAFRVNKIRPTEEKYRELSLELEAATRRRDRAKFDKGLYASTSVEVTDPPVPGSAAAAAGVQVGDRIDADEFRAQRDLAEKIFDGKGEGKSSITLPVAARDGKTKTITLPVKPRPDFEHETVGKGWDELGIKAAPRTKEVLAKDLEDLTREADIVARALAQKEAQYGQGDGAGIVGKSLALLRGMPIIDFMAPPTKIQQISLPELLINYNFKEVPRYDRCTTCHLGIDKPGYDKDADGKPMPLVFRSHPHLTDGTTYLDPRGEIKPAGLYLDSNGPHKINSFGCTICHGGQGSGTTFTFASHTPNTLEQKEEWEHEHDWHEIHHWDEPMLPKRFQESSCLKCHHEVTDVPQAAKLQRGYQRIVKYGCTGCHTIGGPGAIGPDLTDNRPVGPNLRSIASKVTRDWTARWVRNPHHFRPDTRMPRFYDVSNNASPDDAHKVNAEVQAITHYLYTMSAPPDKDHFIDPPAKGDAAKGKQLFLQKGCLACHKHKDFDSSTLPANPPLPIGEYAASDFGPNLSEVAAKFRDDKGQTDAGRAFKWLANWIKAPESYHPKTLMPNLQLSWEDSADIARYLLAVPANWPKPVSVAAIDSDEVRAGLDELTALFLSKSKYYTKPGESLGQTVLLADVDEFVEKLSTEDKLLYVGEKTISRLGCFGCHNIKGFETAKPIGTALNGWGFKSPSKLDFAHIAEYLDDNRTFVDPPAAAESGHASADAGGKIATYDGTDQFYYEKVTENTRMGFLYQKLHRPRSYDYRKAKEDLKSWDDRLRMPQFTWADDPAAIEEVMTFVLGLTGERIPAKYLPRYPAATEALARGEKLLERYNCRGCHVLQMPRYTIAAGTKPSEALPNFDVNLDTSYTYRANDYLPLFYPTLSFDPDKPPELAADEPLGEAVVIEGMPTSIEETEDDKGNKQKRVSVQLWQPVTIRGYTFNAYDRLVVDPSKVKFTPPEGGNFPWLYASIQAEKTGEEFSAFWNKLPPPLIREGAKVQTPWLTNFLRDGYSIRPAAQLRMPRFHYGTTPEQAPPGTNAAAAARMHARAIQEIRDETRDLANYFAARDGEQFPYQDIPQREQTYLAGRESAHEDYLGGGWTIVTKGLCVQCHSVGAFKPTGGANVVNGPDLRQVSERFRPDYLLKWLAHPARLVPYTAMPQNVPPKPSPSSPPPVGLPKSFEGNQLEQVRAMRDMLLNYITAVEQQLAAKELPKPAEAAKPASGSGGN